MAGPWPPGAQRRPVSCGDAPQRSTYRRKREEGDGEDGEAGGDSLPDPRLGHFVPVANGGDRDLQGGGAVVSSRGLRTSAGASAQPEPSSTHNLPPCEQRPGVSLEDGIASHSLPDCARPRRPAPRGGHSAPAPLENQGHPREDQAWPPPAASCLPHPGGGCHPGHRRRCAPGPGRPVRDKERTGMTRHFLPPPRHHMFLVSCFSPREADTAPSLLVGAVRPGPRCRSGAGAAPRAGLLLLPTFLPRAPACSWGRRAAGTPAPAGPHAPGPRGPPRLALGCCWVSQGLAGARQGD